MKKRLIPLLLTLLLLLALPLSAMADQPNKLTLNHTEALVFVSRTLTLRATQEKGFREAVTWTSSDPAVATVTRAGVVRAVAAGSATITATTPSGATAACKVTTEIGAKSVSVQSEGKTVYVGLAGLKLTAVVSPADTTDKTVTWTSSNPSVATVDENGLVTAHKAGSATITVKTKNGVTRRVAVYARIPTTGVKLDQTELTAFAGKAVRLRATVEPSNAYSKAVTWTSSNPAVATVNSYGSVTGKTTGTAIITATTAQGQTAQCTVHVQVGARSVTLSTESSTIYVGLTSAQLTAKVLPEDTTDKTITWTSSNPAVATVDASGRVTPVSAGSVRITATTVNGVRRNYTFYVRVPATSVTFEQPSFVAFAGKSLRIRSTVGPSNAYNKRLTWVSSDPAIASVNQSGTVFGRKTGTVTITATTSAGFSASCKVEVQVAAKSVAITAPEKSLYLGEGGLQLTAAVAPADTTDKTITWTSSRPAVATVDEHGVVRAVSVGTATITATAKSGVRRSIVIHSYQPPLSVTLKETTAVVNVGSNVRLSGSVQPTNAYTRKITWTSTDPAVASVTQTGSVRGKKVGTCKIIARDAKGHEAVCTVSVEIPVRSLSAASKSLTVVTGGTNKASVTVAPTDATNATLTWISSNPAVAKVDGTGVITGMSAGAVTVTARSANGKSVSISVRVVDPATAINLDRGTLSMKSGEAVTLGATVLPVTAGDRTVTWTSSNTEVAAVTTAGKVFAKSAGTCVITAKANGGLNLTAKCTVTVTGTPDKVVALTFDDSICLNTQRQLDLLNMYGIKATFFINTNNILNNATNTAILRALAASGMEIGNHTHSHVKIPQVGVTVAQREIATADSIIEQITGSRPALIRPPYGAMSAAMAKAETRPFINWTIDTRDWSNHNASKIYSIVMGSIKDHDIILMHQHVTQSTEALKKIIPELLQKGYRFVTVSELLDICGDTTRVVNYQILTR